MILALELGAALCLWFGIFAGYRLLQATIDSLEADVAVLRRALVLEEELRATADARLHELLLKADRRVRDLALELHHASADERTVQ